MNETGPREKEALPKSPSHGRYKRVIFSEKRKRFGSGEKSNYINHYMKGMQNVKMPRVYRRGILHRCDHSVRWVADHGWPVGECQRFSPVLINRRVYFLFAGTFLGAIYPPAWLQPFLIRFFWMQPGTPPFHQWLLGRFCVSSWRVWPSGAGQWLPANRVESGPDRGCSRPGNASAGHKLSRDATMKWRWPHGLWEIR